MDIVAILYIIVALVIGVFLGKLIFSKKNITTIIPKDDIDKNTKDYESQVKVIKDKLLLSDQKSAEIKSKYETLLSEANEKIKSLDKGLKNALNGNIDETISQQLNEVDKLKKKIKNLEDENEEFEDDLDDCKKKLKKKDDLYSNLQIDFDKINLNNQHLQEELKSVTGELDFKVKELGLKVESLSFVQEILMAKRANDNSITQVYSRIDNICDFVSDELKEKLSHLYNFDKETSDYLFTTGLASWAITSKKTWIQGKTSVAFVGEFSAGKTSIVNRILSQDDPNVPLLPVSTKATTAIPTYISGGVATMYQFVSPDNDLKSISESTFKRVNKEVLEQVNGVSSLIKYFVMTYKSEILNKISILDTPGFNSNDKEDSERTIDVINECDALYWVFDVNAGTVNRSSINLIKEHLKKPLYVVINKVDTKPKSEVDKVENLIRRTLDDAGQKVEGFIRFSSKSPLSDIMVSINSITHDSNKENYINTILESLKAWITDQQQEVKNAKQNANALSLEYDEVKSDFNRALEDMKSDCDIVAGIPQFESHIFKKDNYEMSQGDYSEMCDLLELISGEHCDMLSNLFDNMNDITNQLSIANEKHLEEKENWRILNNCLDILTAKINELKKNK